MSLLSNQCPPLLTRVRSTDAAAAALVGLHDMIGHSFRYNGREFCIVGTSRHHNESGFLVRGCPIRGCSDEECLRAPTFVNHDGMVQWRTSYLPDAPKGLVKARKSFKNAIYKKHLAHRRLMRSRQREEREDEEDVVVEEREDEEEMDENRVTTTVTTTVETIVETIVETTSARSVATQTDA